jgi:hypothetical protein
MSRLSEMPSTYWLTTYGWSPLVSASSTRAVQNCRTCRVAAISWRNRSRACGSSDSRACSTLIATTWPSGDSPTYTVPWPPAPRKPVSR